MKKYACLFMAFGALFGCKAKERVKPVDPPGDIQELYEATEARLLSGFADRQIWVVSRHSDSSAANQGDSLLWSGLALSALSCEYGASIETGLRESINRLGGALIRYEPLPASYRGNEVSADGAIGLYRGLAGRFKRCGGAKAYWRDTLKTHVAYLDAHSGSLHPPAPARIGILRHLLNMLLYAADASGTARPSDSGALQVEMTAWAAATVAAKAPAYRIHLAMLVFEALEDLGDTIAPDNRNAFCAVTAGADMPTVDNWCGRKAIRAWIDTFQENQYQFRFQRAAWESPDGNGDAQPSLDLIVALKDGYNL